LEIGFPIVQAALSGYSDWPMRLLARRHGASYSLCEVMLDQFLVALKTRDKTRHFLYNTQEEQPVAGQLMGAEPQQFAAGAAKLVEAGFAVIDINFGCPVRKVLGRCRGGYHLSQPQVALEIVERTRDVVPPEIPVTVKMRRGIDDSQQSRDRFFEILNGAFARGVAAVTVHGRTVEQGYRGPSRWSFLKEVKEMVGDRTILGSGDLFSALDCWRMIQETGIDGVTVARGAIGNPWIFEQCRALAAGDPMPPPPCGSMESSTRQAIRTTSQYAPTSFAYEPARTGRAFWKNGILGTKRVSFLLQSCIRLARKVAEPTELMHGDRQPSSMDEEIRLPCALGRSRHQIVRASGRISSYSYSVKRYSDSVKRYSDSKGHKRQSQSSTTSDLTRIDLRSNMSRLHPELRHRQFGFDRRTHDPRLRAARSIPSGIWLARPT